MLGEQIINCWDDACWEFVVFADTEMCCCRFELRWGRVGEGNNDRYTGAKRFMRHSTDIFDDKDVIHVRIAIRPL